jgi:hypothetical protein
VEGRERCGEEGRLRKGGERKKKVEARERRKIIEEKGKERERRKGRGGKGEKENHRRKREGEGEEERERRKGVVHGVMKC